MIHTLYLLRHAEASPARASTDDHERPLTGRGRAEARSCGEWLRGRNLRPGRVYCSTSLRTRQTLEEIGEGYGVDFPEIPREFLPEIYHASPEALLALIHDLPEEAHSAVIIGHNPGLYQLAANLAGEGEDACLDALAQGFPTGGAAALRLNIPQWQDIRPGGGCLIAFHTPRTLTPAD